MFFFWKTSSIHVDCLSTLHIFMETKVIVLPYWKVNTFKNIHTLFKISVVSPPQVSWAFWNIKCILKMIWQFFGAKEWNEGANDFTVKTRFQSFISINDFQKLMGNRSQTFFRRNSSHPSPIKNLVCSRQALCWFS